MVKISTFMAAMLLLLTPWVVEAEVHKAVQAALDYEIPENTCVKPKTTFTEKSVTAPAQDAGSASFFEGSSASNVTDTDSYTRNRAARKEKRWKKSVDKYKKGLLADMETLKSSAQHGLTQAQAETILGKMATIQAVYMTPDGVLEPAEAQASANAPADS